MKMLTITAAALCLGAISAPADAQDEPARRAATEVAARVPFEKPMKGAPYTADTVVEGTQTLADGNRIHRKTTGRVYRDGEGRTRREEDRPNGSTSVSIVDPVAGFSYSLDPQNKIAWRTPAGVGGAIMGKLEASEVAVARKIEGVRTTSADGTPRVTFVESARTEAERAAAAKVEQEKVEQARAAGGGGGGRGGARGGGGGFGGAVVSPTMRGGGPEASTPLEHKSIDGVAVEGRKTTTVIPAGQIGNDQPLTIVDEQWRSPDLNVLVMTRHVDPRTGESSYRLANIIRAEPDASLFLVPPDYTVKDTGIRKMLEAKLLEASMRK